MIREMLKLIDNFPILTTTILRIASYHLTYVKNSLILTRDWINNWSPFTSGSYNWRFKLMSDCGQNYIDIKWLFKNFTDVYEENYISIRPIIPDRNDLGWAFWAHWDLSLLSVSEYPPFHLYRVKIRNRITIFYRLK